MDALTAHFTSKRNKMYESIIFRRTAQRQGETVDQFCTRLRKLTVGCEFDNTEREIATQIIDNCTSQRLRRRAKDISLDQLLEMARSLEVSAARALDIENNGAIDESGQVNQIHQPHRPRQRKCYQCGGDYPHPTENECKAMGKKCYNCGGMNHLASVCRSARAAASAHDQQEINDGSDKNKAERVANRQNKERVNKIESDPANDTITFDADDEEDYVF
jgi:hypothetical protein